MLKNTLRTTSHLCRNGVSAVEEENDMCLRNDQLSCTNAIKMFSTNAIKPEDIYTRL